MRSHKGMRPHDLVVLLKISSMEGHDWRHKDLSDALYISTSEISESLERSVTGGLLDHSKRKVFTRSLLDFLFFGMRHVFPAVPGALTKGIPTAHSAPVFNNYFGTSEPYVWPDIEGEERGQSIEPFYAGLTKAVKKDHELYDLLALCDTLRLGKVREINTARKLLEKKIRKQDVQGQ
jgi:hypothetical protein